MQKVVLITGASAGIGKESAIQLASKGYIVYAAARRTNKLKELESYGIRSITLDVTQEDSIINCVKTIIKAGNRIDILVNNAGYGSYGAVEDVPIEEAKYQFEVNIFGLARLSQEIIPHMRNQKSGKIINISSIGGRFGEPHGAWYHATKFALEGFSDSLRMELKQFGIDVVVVQPGAITSEWNKIARDKMFQTSGSTAYGDLVKKHISLFKYAETRSSSPKVIADVIFKAIKSSRPKTRYVAGEGAKPLVFLKKLLSDKSFDKLLLGQISKKR
ncbi:oxidoreductase [Ancylomarina sp. DW003]|nr:oxidoreductase [Ancylomarina sp. DW003]MDE5421982.1 oxidoreductase [Ancylomarina sp. DW003]